VRDIAAYRHRNGVCTAQASVCWIECYPARSGDKDFRPRMGRAAIRRPGKRAVRVEDGAGNDPGTGAQATCRLGEQNGEVPACKSRIRVRGSPVAPAYLVLACQPYIESQQASYSDASFSSMYHMDQLRSLTKAETAEAAACR
jgi:hypothetical protein